MGRGQRKEGRELEGNRAILEILEVLGILDFRRRAMKVQYSY